MTWFYSVLAVVQPPASVPQVAIDDTLVKNIFNLVLALAGAIAVAFIIWGGTQYILSQGEANKIKTAKDTILYSLIGLVIVIFSFAILNFVIGKF